MKKEINYEKNKKLYTIKRIYYKGLFKNKC